MKTVNHRWSRHISRWTVLLLLLTLTEKTSLPKVIWEEGRVAALSHTYAVKSPLVTMVHPKFAPKSKKHPFSWTDPQTRLRALSLGLSDLWCQTASGFNPPFFHNALDRQTDGQTDRPTDRQIVHRKFFRRRVLPETSCLHYLLPEKNDPGVTSKLRHPKTFQSLTVKTERFRKSFMPYCLRHYQ